MVKISLIRAEADDCLGDSYPVVKCLSLHVGAQELSALSHKELVSFTPVENPTSVSCTMLPTNGGSFLVPW